eukprot:jgi/Ulvmu1/5836/UM025_0094.1
MQQLSSEGNTKQASNQIQASGWQPAAICKSPQATIQCNNNTPGLPSMVCKARQSSWQGGVLLGPRTPPWRCCLTVLLLQQELERHQLERHRPTCMGLVCSEVTASPCDFNVHMQRMTDLVHDGATVMQCSPLRGRLTRKAKQERHTGD